jgi:hypothetical protein
VVRESVSLAPTPTRGEFNRRLLLHVDSSGQTRLLKEVIQMYQEAATTIDGSGNTVVTRPGRSVLLTDDSLISSFSGVTQRDVSGHPKCTTSGQVKLYHPGLGLVIGFRGWVSRFVSVDLGCRREDKALQECNPSARRSRVSESFPLPVSSHEALGVLLSSPANPGPKR